MHISIVDISNMVTARANHTIAIKYEDACGLSNNIFIFDLIHSKNQGQGNIHIITNISTIVTDMAYIATAINNEVEHGPSINIFIFDLGTL